MATLTPFPPIARALALAALVLAIVCLAHLTIDLVPETGAIALAFAALQARGADCLEG